MNKGLVTTTKPLPLKVLADIKQHLSDKPRELAWLAVSTNSAFRGGDVLKLTLSCIRTHGTRIELTHREAKTGKLRVVLLNDETSEILRKWLAVHPGKTDYIFEGKRGKMGTSYWGCLLRDWCKEVGYDEERIATHSCRKTFARIHYERGAKLATLMVALNHTSEANTLKYINVLPEEIDALYASSI